MMTPPSRRYRAFCSSASLECQRTGSPAPAVQEFPLAIDLLFHTPLSVVAELAIELAAVFPDGPKVFTRLPLAWRGCPVGRVEWLIAHR
jgi:hypothetical protein